MRLAECVPNVSEGRNINNINKMRDAILTVPGIALLHLDSNGDANRTVFTFAGTPDKVIDAAYELFLSTMSLIDMRSQRGEHVRNGGLDVCPIIPVSDISTEECVIAARALARRIGEAGAPVFLYGEAATQAMRKELSNIRNGQYEALKTKLQLPKWRPDFGPAHWTEVAARTGSVQVGVRPFLVAYNVNLKTRDVKIAKKIARLIRTSGFRGIKGEFNHLKADGWWMKTYNCAQITMNLTSYPQTPIHLVYERVRLLAQEMGTDTNGSELIGMIPLNALQAAGRFYTRLEDSKTMPQTGLSDNFDDLALISLAVQKLGLDYYRPFVPRERIFEYRLADLQCHSQGVSAY